LALKSLRFLPEVADGCYCCVHGAQRAITIAKAKQRLAKTFGVDPEAIEITIRA
jgi:hypothetical protein